MVVRRVISKLDDAGRTFAVRVHKVERHEEYVAYSGIPTVEYGLGKGSTCRGVGGAQVGIILLSLFWMRSQFTLLFPLTAVYPSLESDDDDPALKSRHKKKKNSDDAPWSPKGDPVFCP